MKADFTVDSINLTMTDQTTGAPLTANVYRLEGVNGGNPISIGQLVMALCLDRAADLESSIIELMQEMDATSDDLERLTEIESRLIEGNALTDAERAFLTEQGVSLAGSNDDVITAIESKMDSLNSFSQEKMIELQSQTNKRDQAYDMVANVLKSFNTVLVGIANNL